MTMLSNTTGLAVAVQSAKGTAATSGFYRMRLEQSSVWPVFDYEDARDEHTGVHQRASNRQTTPDRISKMIRVSGSGFVYPSSLGVLLVGAGFAASTADNTTYKTHTITKADTDAAKWLSVLYAIGEDSGRFERKVTDVRLTSLTFTATRQGLRVAFEGIGLDEAESAGTETVTADPNFRIKTTTGAFTWGALALGAPREHTITIARPVDTEDQKQHAFGRAGADETGFEIDVALRGLDMVYASYKKLNWGGASGTELDEACVTDAITVKWESKAAISGAAVPYSVQFALTKADIRMTPPTAQGAGIIRLDAGYSMIDDTSSAPVTVTLVNSVASY
jgi:hypothetical protein